MASKAEKAARRKAENAFMAKVGSTGETAQNVSNLKREYELTGRNKKPLGPKGKYNPRVHKELSDSDYAALHNTLPKHVDKKRFKKLTGKEFNPNSKGGTVRMKSGGPVVDSYDYS
tara:strand:+ start:57 stop:404 length:348 start_codon:yes stop_codon:yes gene_type:complete